MTAAAPQHVPPPSEPHVPGDSPTVVQCAARDERLDELRDLLAKGASPDSYSPHNNCTALHVACMTGNIPAARVLLTAGAAPDSRDSWDNTPLHHAAYYGHYHTLCVVVRACTSATTSPASSLVNKRNSVGMTPLYIAAVRGDAKTCNFLMKKGADPSLTAARGRTALHEAALCGSLDCVDLLIRAQADPNARDADQRTPLHYAVLEENEEERRDVVATLVRAGAATGASDRFGMTPLHYAILNGYDCMLNMFVQNNDGSNICIIYQLKKKIEERQEIEKPPVPARVQTPAPRPSKSPYATSLQGQATRQRKRSVLYLVEPGRPLPDGVSPDEVNPAPDTPSPSLPTAVAEGGGAPALATTPQVATECLRDGETVAPPNRYGFVSIGPLTNATEMSEDRKIVEARHANKWSVMLKDWDNVVSKRWRLLHSRVYKGIPECVRGEAWCRFAGVQELIQKNPRTYQVLLGATPDSKVTQQIDNDIKRAHLEHEMFARSYSKGQIALFNVLRAYSIHDPAVGYTQGMADIVGFLLMYMTEEEAFWLFVQLMNDPKWQMHGAFAEGFPQLLEVCYVQAALLERSVPRLAQHFKKVGFDLRMLHPHDMEWYMVLFTRVLPFEHTIRLFDVIMADGCWAALGFALGLYRILEPKLLALGDQFFIMQALKKPAESLTSFSPDLLVNTAKGLQPTQRTVDSLIREYQATLQPKPNARR